MDMIDEKKAHAAQKIPSGTCGRIQGQPQKKKKQTPFFAGQFPKDLHTAPYEGKQAEKDVDIQENERREQVGRQMHHAEEKSRNTYCGSKHADPGDPNVPFEFWFHDNVREIAHIFEEAA